MTLKEALKEITRLRAIVDKQPKTADGVVVFEGMKVWSNQGQTTIEDEISTVVLHDAGEYSFLEVNYPKYYSTREAASAALKEQQQ